MPLKKWVQIVMSVDDKTIYVSTRHRNGHVLEKEENAIHKEWVIEKKIKFLFAINLCYGVKGQ